MNWTGLGGCPKCGRPPESSVISHYCSCDEPGKEKLEYVDVSGMWDKWRSMEHPKREWALKMFSQWDGFPLATTGQKDPTGPGSDAAPPKK